VTVSVLTKRLKDGNNRYYEDAHGHDGHALKLKETLKKFQNYVNNLELKRLHPFEVKIRKYLEELAKIKVDNVRKIRSDLIKKIIPF
jgi:hypothetical protein